jgi:hypothetical protein
VAGPSDVGTVMAEEEEAGRIVHGSAEVEVEREEAPAKMEESSRLTCDAAGGGRARRRAEGAPDGVTSAGEEVEEEDCRTPPFPNSTFTVAVLTVLEPPRFGGGGRSCAELD